MSLREYDEKLRTQLRRLGCNHPFNRWFLPELQRFENDAERYRALRQSGKVPGFNLGMLILILLVSLLLKDPVQSLAAKIPLIPNHRFIGYFFFFVIMMTASMAWNFMYRKPMRRRLRLALIAAGRPVCMQCGYYLQGLVKQRCPECGTPFDLAKPPYAQSKNEGGAPA